ncbi:dipeptide ABC transporter ATP-binding protein [Pseudoclavibacter soli]|uniref:dipeptide ABC transporter ATP-binding protein n=1 Tax=Pseudoclavibacter soli TaxID=452623 RepID=UPI0004250CB1|nr:ABC transporter ATP-binding protein [Pseudoclavibacter soli]
MTALLQVTDLHIDYDLGRGRRQHAVAGVSFALDPGEVVAIVGESGSGKSTTAHSIINLLAGNARRVSGDISFDGADLTQLTEKEWESVRGARIALIPQDPTVSLDPVRRVGDQVAEVLRLHGLADRADAAHRAVELLELAGIPDAELRSRQYPHQFSGGMRQRVLIAAALAADPRLVIADEPTSALDVTVQKQILDHIEQRAAQLGTAVLLITHDLGVAADRASRIIVMQHGRIVEQGLAEQVLRDPQQDYTKQLIAAAPSISATTARPTAQVSVAAAEGIPVLELHDVVKEFALPDRGLLRAVDGVSLQLHRGETLALVGESGSGKSTTARLALRIDEPTAGRIVFDGEDITAVDRRTLKAFRRRVQFVYQSPYASLNPRFTLEQIIAEPLRAHRVGSRDQRHERALELLDQVRLPARLATRRPTELSGGQRQRVAIARALALEPDVVVLDEAVSALDVSVQRQILDLLAENQQRHQLSYLFITHDLAVVSQIADRVVVLQRGRVVETGATEQVLRHPREPYTQQLVQAIPGRRLHEPAFAEV